MLFLGRTGSTFVIDVFNQHPRILFEGEWLETFKNSDDPIGNQTRWIESLWGEENRAKYCAIGFKTKTIDIPDLKAFKEQIGLFRPTILLSLRDNVIKHAISVRRIEQRAEKIKAELTPGQWETKRRTPAMWNVYDPKDSLGPTIVDVVELHKLVLWIETESDSLQQLVNELVEYTDLDVISFDYDDIIHSSNLFFKKNVQSIRR